MKPEKLLALQIARYLQMQYPDVIYRYDLAADIRLTIGQARRNKALHPTRGYPDLFIAAPTITISPTDSLVGYCGLFLELKAEGTKILNKSGNYATPHLVEQVEMLERLRKAGYQAEMATGFDQAKEIIDKYLAGCEG